MEDCRTCKRTDVKCCPTCGRGDDCDVYHRCGEDCIGHKPKTNADRIRSMTDEELAIFLSDYAYESNEDDMVTVLAWLKSKVGCE